MIGTVYLSSRNRAAEVLRYWRDHYLEPAGYRVVSRWLDEGKGAEPCRATAERDWEDLHAVDAVVCYNPQPWAREGRGGRHAEVTVALMRGIPVVIVGVRTNVFHYMRGVHTVPDVEQAVIMLDYLGTL